MENDAQRFGKNSISSTWMVGAACHEEVQATSGSVLAERDVPGQKQIRWAAAEVSAWHHAR
jgi:hypothetical protein